MTDTAQKREKVEKMIDEFYGKSDRILTEEEVSFLLESEQCSAIEALIAIGGSHINLLMKTIQMRIQQGTIEQDFCQKYPESVSKSKD